MKLHLPTRLRKALLACLASMVVPAFSLTVSSGSALAGSAAIVSFLLSQSALADGEDGGDDATDPLASEVSVSSKNEMDAAYRDHNTSEDTWVMGTWTGYFHGLDQGDREVWFLTIDANVRFDGSWTINNGSSNGANEQRFNGAISGSGSLIWNWNAAQTLYFNGNIEDWSGDITREKGTLTVNIGGVTSNSGSITANTLILNGTALNNSSVDVDTLQLDGDASFINAAGTLTVGALSGTDHTLTFSGGSLTITGGTLGTLNLTDQNSTITLNGGTLTLDKITFNGGSNAQGFNIGGTGELVWGAQSRDTIILQNLQLSSGIKFKYNASSDWGMFSNLDIAGALEVAGKEMCLQNTNHFGSIDASAGQLTLMGGSSVTVDEDAEFTGVFQMRGSSTLEVGRNLTVASIHNADQTANNSSVTVGGNLTINGSSNATYHGGLDVTGSITMSGSATQNFGTAAGTTLHAGSVTVQSGALSFGDSGRSGDFTIDGAISIASGASLTWKSAGMLQADSISMEAGASLNLAFVEGIGLSFRSIGDGLYLTLTGDFTSDYQLFDSDTFLTEWIDLIHITVTGSTDIWKVNEQGQLVMMNYGDLSWDGTGSPLVWTVGGGGWTTGGEFVDSANVTFNAGAGDYAVQIEGDIMAHSFTIEGTEATSYDFTAEDAVELRADIWNVTNASGSLTLTFGEGVSVYVEGDATFSGNDARTLSFAEALTVDGKVQMWGTTLNLAQGGEFGVLDASWNSTVNLGADLFLHGWYYNNSGHGATFTNTSDSDVYIVLDGGCSFNANNETKLSWTGQQQHYTFDRVGLKFVSGLTLTITRASSVYASDDVDWDVENLWVSGAYITLENTDFTAQSAVLLDEEGTLTLASGATLTANTIEVTSGSLILSGGNTITGAVTLTGGSLTLSNGGAQSTISGTLTVNGGEVSARSAIELDSLAGTGGSVLVDNGSANAIHNLDYDGTLQAYNSSNVLTLTNGGRVGTLAAAGDATLKLGADLTVESVSKSQDGYNLSNAHFSAVEGQTASLIFDTTGGDIDLSSYNWDYSDIGLGVKGGHTLTINNATFTTLSIEGSSTLLISSSKTLTLTGSSSVTGSLIDVAEGGTLKIKNGSLSLSGNTSFSGKFLLDGDGSHTATATVSGSLSANILQIQGGEITLEQGGDISELQFDFYGNNGAVVKLGADLTLNTVTNNNSASADWHKLSFSNTGSDMVYVIAGSYDTLNKLTTVTVGEKVGLATNAAMSLSEGFTFSGTLKAGASLALDGSVSLGSLLLQGQTLTLGGDSILSVGSLIGGGSTSAAGVIMLGSLRTSGGYLDITGAGSTGYITLDLDGIVLSDGLTIELFSNFSSIESGWLEGLEFDLTGYNARLWTVRYHKKDGTISISANVPSDYTWSMEDDYLIWGGDEQDILWDRDRRWENGSSVAFEGRSRSADDMPINVILGEDIETTTMTLRGNAEYEFSGAHSLTVTSALIVGAEIAVTFAEDVTLSFTQATVDGVLEVECAVAADDELLLKGSGNIALRGGLSGEGSVLIDGDDLDVTLGGESFSGSINVEQGSLITKQGLTTLSSLSLSGEGASLDTAGSLSITSLTMGSGASATLGGDLSITTLTLSDASGNYTFSADDGVTGSTVLVAESMSVNDQEYTFQKNDGAGDTSLTVANLLLANGAEVNINGVDFTVTDSIEITGLDATISVTDAQLALGDGVFTTANISLLGDSSLATSGHVTIGSLATDSATTVSLGGTLTVNGDTDLTNFTFVNAAPASYALGDADDATSWLEQIIDETVSKTAAQLGTYEAGTGFKKSGSGTLTITEGTLTMPIWVNAGGLTINSGVTAGDVLVTTGGTLTLGGDNLTFGNVTIDGGSLAGLTYGATTVADGMRHVSFENLTIKNCTWSVTGTNTNNHWGLYLTVTGTLTIGDGQEMIVNNASIGKLAGSGTLHFTSDDKANTTIGGGFIGALEFCWMDTKLTLTGDLEVAGNLYQRGNNSNHQLLSDNKSHLILGSATYAAKTSYAAFLQIYTSNTPNAGAWIKESTFTAGIGIGGGQSATFTENDTTWAHSFIVTSGATLTVNGSGFTMDSDTTLTVGNASGAAGTLNLNTTLDLTQGGTLVVNSNGRVNVNSGAVLKTSGNLSLGGAMSLAGRIEHSGGLLSLSSLTLSGENATLSLDLSGLTTTQLHIDQFSAGDYQLTIFLEDLNLTFNAYELFDSTTWALLKDHVTFDWLDHKAITNVSVDENGNLQLTGAEPTLALDGSTLVWIGTEEVSDGVWSGADVDLEWSVDDEEYSYVNGHSYSVTFAEVQDGSNIITEIELLGNISVVNMSVEDNYTFSGEAATASLSVTGELSVAEYKTASFSGDYSLNVATLTGAGSLELDGVAATLTAASDFSGSISTNANLTLASGFNGGDIDIVFSGSSLTLNGNTLGDVTMNGGAIYLGESAVTFHDLSITSITNGSTSEKMGTINVTGTLTIGSGVNNFFVQDSTINNVACSGTLYVNGKANSGMGTRINGGFINQLYLMWQDSILTLGGDLEVGAIGGTLNDYAQYINKAADATGPVHLILTSLNKIHDHAVDVSTFNGFLNMYRVRAGGVRSKVTINAGVGVSGLELTFAVGSTTSASETWSNDFIVKGASGGASGSLTVNGATGVTGASFAMAEGKTLTVGANATLTLNALLDLGTTGALTAQQGSTITLGADGGLKVRGALSLYTFNATAGSTLSLSAFDILSASDPLITFNTGASGALILDLTGLDLVAGDYQLFDGTFSDLTLTVQGYLDDDWTVTYESGTLHIVSNLVTDYTWEGNEESIIWGGDGEDVTWDVERRWRNGAAVTFSGTSDSGDVAVSLGADIEASSMTVDGDAEYTFTGEHSLAVDVIIVDEQSTVTIADSITFTLNQATVDGLLDVQGTVEVGESLTLEGSGSISLAGLAGEGGTLNINGGTLSITSTLATLSELTLNGTLKLGKGSSDDANQLSIAASGFTFGVNGKLAIDSTGLDDTTALFAFTGEGGYTLSSGKLTIDLSAWDLSAVLTDEGREYEFALFSGLTLGGTDWTDYLTFTGFSEAAGWEYAYVDGKLVFSHPDYEDTITWVGGSGSWSADDTEAGEWENNGRGVTFANPHTGDHVNVLFDTNDDTAETITVSGAVSVWNMSVDGSYVFSAGTEGSLAVDGDLEVSGSASFGVGVTLAGELTGEGSLTVADGGSLTLRSSSAGYSGSIILSRTGSDTNNAAIIIDSGVEGGSAISLGGNITLTARPEGSGPDQPAQYVIFVKNNDTVSIGDADSTLDMNGENIVFFSQNSSSENYIHSALVNWGVVKLIGNQNANDPAVNLHLTHDIVGSETDTTFETHRHAGNGIVNLYLDGDVSELANLKTIDVCIYLTGTLEVGEDGLTIWGKTANSKVYVQGSLEGAGDITFSSGELTLGGEADSDLSGYTGTLTIGGGTLNISSEYGSGLTIDNGTVNVLAEVSTETIEKSNGTMNVQADVSGTINQSGGTLNVQADMSGTINQTNGTLNVQADMSGTINQTNGTLNVLADVTSGTISMSNGTAYVKASVSENITISGGSLRLQKNGDTDTATHELGGLKISGGSLSVDSGTWSMGESTYVSGSMATTVSAGATLILTGDLKTNARWDMKRNANTEELSQVQIAAGKTLEILKLEDSDPTANCGGEFSLYGEYAGTNATLKITNTSGPSTVRRITIGSGVTLELADNAKQNLVQTTINGDIKLGSGALLIIQTTNDLNEKSSIGGTVSGSGTLQVDTEVDFSGTVSGASLALNAGTLNLSHSGNTAHNLGTIAVSSSGTLNVQSGEWNLAGLSGDAAAASISSGATLVLGSSATLSSLSLEGTLKFGKGLDSTANQLTVAGDHFSFGTNGKLAIDSTGLDSGDTALALLAFSGDGYTMAEGTLNIDLTAWTNLAAGSYHLFSGLSFDGDWADFLSFSGYNDSVWEIDYADGYLSISRIALSDLYWATDADGVWSADDTNDDWADADGEAGAHVFASDVNVHFGSSTVKTISVDGDVSVGGMEVSADGYTFSAAETGGSITVNGGLSVTTGTLTLRNITTTVTGSISASGATLKLADGAMLTLEQGGTIGTLNYQDDGDRTVSLGGDLTISKLLGSAGAAKILRFKHMLGDEVEESDFVTVTITNGQAVPSTSLFFGKGVNVDFQWVPSEGIAKECTWTIEENLSWGAGKTFLIGLNKDDDTVSVDDKGTVIVGKDISGAHLNVQNSLSSLTVGGDLELANRLTNNGTISVGGNLSANNITHNKGQLTVTGKALTNEALALSGGTISVGKNLTVTTRLTANGGTLTVAGTLTAGEIYVDGGTLVLSNDISVAKMGGGTFNRYGIDDDPELEAITVSFSTDYNDAFKKNMTFGKGVNALFTGAFTAYDYTGTLMAAEDVTFNGNMSVSTGTVSVGGNMTFNSGSLTLNNGNGSVTVDGTLNLAVGNLTLTNGTLAAGHLTMAGEAVLEDGTLTVTGSGGTSTIGTLKGVDNSDVRLTLGEDLEITSIDANGADHFHFTRYVADGEDIDDLGAVTVTIAGLVNHAAQDMTFGDKVNLHVTSSGTIRYSGELNVGGNATLDGEFLLSDATVTIGGDLTTTQNGIAVDSNTGNFGINNSAKVSIGGSADIAGAFQLYGAATVSVGEDMTIYKGVTVADNDASLEVSGDMTLKGSDMDFLVYSSAEITIDGTLTLSRDLKVQNETNNASRLGGATIDIGTDLTGVGSITVSATNGATITVDGNMTLSTGSVNLESGSASLTVKGEVKDICNIKLSASGASFTVDGKLTMSNGSYNMTIGDGATLKLGNGASIAGNASLAGSVYLNGGTLDLKKQLSGTGKLYVDISEDSTAQLQLSGSFGANTSIQLGFDADELTALVGTAGYQLFTTDNWQSSWLDYFDLYTLNTGFSRDAYDITITADGYLRIVALGDDLVWNDDYDTTNDWYADNDELTDWFYDDTTRQTAFSNNSSVKFLGTGETISLHGAITVGDMDVEGEYTFTSTDAATLTITGTLTIGEGAAMTVSWGGVTVQGTLDAEDGTLSIGSDQSITLQQGGTLGTLKYAGTQGNGATLTLGDDLSIGTLNRQSGPLNINAMTGKEVTVSIDNGLQNVNTGTVNFGEGVNLTLTQSVNFGQKTVLNMAGGDLKVQGDFTGAQALTLNGNGTIEGKVTMTDRLMLNGTGSHSFTIKSTETSSIGTLVNGAAASTFYLGGDLNISQLGQNPGNNNPIDNSGAITFNRYSESGTITVTIDGFQSVAGKDITFGTGVEAVFTHGLTGTAYTGTLTVAENATFGETNGLTVGGGTVDVTKNVTLEDAANLTLSGSGTVSVGGNLTAEEGSVTVSGAGTLSVTGNLTMESGTLTVSNAGANVTVGETLSADVLALSNGTVEVTGNASLTGTSEISGGSFTVSGSTGLTASGAISVSGGSVKVTNTFAAQHGLGISGGSVTANVLNVTGDLTLEGGLLTVNNSLSVSGTVNIDLTGTAMIKLGEDFQFGATALSLVFTNLMDYETQLLGDGVALFDFEDWSGKKDWADLSKVLQLSSADLPAGMELRVGRLGHLLLVEEGGLSTTAVLTWAGQDGTWGAEESTEEWDYKEELYGWSQSHDVIFVDGEKGLSHTITLAGDIEVGQMDVKSGSFTFTVNDGDASLSGTALKIEKGASATFGGDAAEDTVVSFEALSGAGSLTVSGSSVAVENVENFTGNVTVSGGELSLQGGEDGLSLSGDISVSGGELTLTTTDDGALTLGDVEVSGGTLNLNAAGSVDSLDATGGEVHVAGELSVAELSGGANGVIDGDETGSTLTVQGGSSYSGQLKDIGVDFDLGSGSSFTLDGELMGVDLTVTSGTLTMGATNEVDSLAFGANGELKIEEEVTLTVNDALSGGGSISGDGALTLKGSAAGGDYSGSLVVGALTIGGKQTLSGTVEVSGALTVETDGALTIGDFSAASASVSGSLTLTDGAEISGVLQLDEAATFDHDGNTVQVGGLTGGLELDGITLVITGTDAAQSYEGNVENADITVSGGQQTFTGSFSSSSLAMNGGELTLTDASATLGTVTATDGSLTVGDSAEMSSLTKSGEGTLTLSGGAISVTGAISISGTGRVDVTADSLDISGGLSFTLDTTLNSLDTAYLHGLDGNLLVNSMPADGISLGIDGELVRGTYYLASGLDGALTLDDFNYDGALESLLAEMNQGLPEGEEWQLALDLTDGVLSLKVTYTNTNQWIWDGSHEGDNVWRDDSSNNWNHDEDGGTNQGNRQVYFYGEGDGEIEVSGTVTPGAMVVKDGHYIFTSDGSGEGIDLQGEVDEKDRNDDNEGGKARLVVGGEQTEAHVELNLKNRNIPLVDLLENGKLTIGHENAVNGDATITMDGGTLAIGEGEDGSLILTDLGDMTLTLEGGSALKLQVGKTYTEFDSADDYLGVSGVAMFAVRTTDVQTFTLTSGDTVKDALVNGIVKTGRQTLMVLIDEDALDGSAVSGAMSAQEGTLSLVFETAAEVDAALSVTTGATLRLESTDDTLTLQSSFTSVEASAALAEMLGEDAAARVELVGNVVLDAAVDNSAYAGVLALEGSVMASAGASLGGADTELELGNGTLTLADEVAEVSVGTINVVGSQSISQDEPLATLKAGQVIGTGTLAAASNAVNLADDSTLTLEADLAAFEGALQTGDVSWTLAGAQSSDTLGVSLMGAGEFIFSSGMATGNLILTGAIGANGSATDLVNELGGTIVIAGNGLGSTGSLTGNFQLGDADHSGSWGGTTLADGATFALVNGELSGSGFTKGDGAELLADVVRGGAVNVNGMDGSNFDGIVVRANGQLQNVSGTITAGGASGITVQLVFDENSVGSSAGGDYMITGNGTLTVEDAEGLTLDFTNTSFVDLLTKHRNEGAESWLHLFEGGSIEFGDAFAEAEENGMLSSVLKASGLGKVLYELGFNVTVQGGDLVLTGTSTDVYLVVDGNEDVSNDSNVEGWYEGLGGHKATVVDGTLDVTAGDTDAEAQDFGYTWDEDTQMWTSTTDDTTKSDDELKTEKGLTDVQLNGVKNDQLNGGRTVNNLVGLDGSEFNAHHSNGSYDPDADEREQIVFNNSTVGDHDSTGLPGDADGQLSENNGVDTVFEGTINGDEGVDFVKKGAGSLTVGSESGKGGVNAGDSDFLLEDGSFIVQGGDDNHMRDLVFSDGENEGGFGFTNGSKTTVESIVESGSDGGNVSIDDGAELVLTGESELSDTHISGDGSGTLTVDGEEGHLSFTGDGTEDAVLDDVNVTVQNGGSLELHDGASLSSTHGADVTVTGEDSSITLDDDSHLNTNGSLTLEDGGLLDLGNSSDNSAGQLNGNGTLTGGADSSLEVTGKGGVFSGTLAGATDGTGGGTLKVGEGADLTLDNITTDANNKWQADVDGALTVDVTSMVDGDQVDLDITLNEGSNLNVVFDAMSQLDSLQGELSVTGPADLTLTSDGKPPRSGQYDLGMTLDEDSDLGDLNLNLAGLAFSHFDGELKEYENGQLYVDLTKLTHNDWMRPEQEKNAKAGATVFWDATDPDSSSYEYIQNHPDGDLAQFAQMLYWMNYNGDYAGMDRALAAGVGASTSTLSPAINRDVHRQLSSLRNRVLMAEATPEVPKTTTEPNIRMWMSAESGYYNLSASGLAPGFTLNGWGGSVGMDTDVSRDVVLGFAITAMYNDLKTHSADAGKGDVDTTYLSAYARVQSGAWTHSFVVTGGTVDASLNRTVSTNPTLMFGFLPMAGQTYTTKGETTGYALGAMYEVGYTCAMNEAGTLALQPVANVLVAHSALSGYTETGSDAALNVGNMSQTQVTVGLGARLQGVLHEDALGRDAIFETRALVKGDFGDRSGKSNNSLLFGSTSAEVESARAGAVGIELGAGLSVPVGSAGGSIFVDATVEFRNHANTFNATAGYRISF